MFTDYMYETWIYNNELSFIETKHFLKHFLSSDTNGNALDNTLHLLSKQNAFSKEEKQDLEAVLKNSNSFAALRAQLSYFSSAKEDEASHIIKAFSTQELLKAFDLDEVKFSFAFLQAFWKNNDASLRLKVLKHAGSRLGFVPKEWFDWLLAEYFLIENQPLPKDFWFSMPASVTSAFWDRALEKASSEVMRKVYYSYYDIFGGSLPLKCYNDLLELCESLLQTSIAEPSFSDTCLYYYAARFFVSGSNITPHLLKIGEMLQNKYKQYSTPTNDSTYKSFSSMFSSVLHTSNMKHRENLADAFYSLSSDELFTDKLYQLFYKFNAKTISLDDALFKDIVLHKNFPMEELFDNLVLNSKVESLREVISYKDDKSIIAFALRAYKTSAHNLIFLKILEVISVEIKNKIISLIIEKNFNALDYFVQHGLVTKEIIFATKVSTLDKYMSNNKATVFHTVTVETLGENLDKWEMFTCLSKNFTGTYGELLEAASLLNA